MLFTVKFISFATKLLILILPGRQYQNEIMILVQTQSKYRLEAQTGMSSSRPRNHLFMTLVEPLLLILLAAQKQFPIQHKQSLRRSTTRLRHVQLLPQRILPVRPRVVRQIKLRRWRLIVNLMLILSFRSLFQRPVLLSRESTMLLPIIRQ